ncbi:hypothetical protein ACWCPT_29625 [Streptomyces sp. NPDC002308]
MYETQAELDAAEATYRRANAIERACKATGKPCEHTGNHHVESAHQRGLHLRADNGLFHSGVRAIVLDSCRWCGHVEEGHCGGYRTGRGLHAWEHPTDAQLRARKIAAGLDPDVETPIPDAPQPFSQSGCCCDGGDEDAAPCDEDDCVIAELLAIGRPH